jgi:hypothetical protein
VCGHRTMPAIIIRHTLTLRRSRCYSQSSAEQDVIIPLDRPIARCGQLRLG